MLKTINIDTVVHVELKESEVNDGYTFFPAEDRKVSFLDDPIGFFMGKTIHLPDRVQFTWSEYWTDVEDMSDDLYIKDGKVWRYAYVTYETVSGSRTTYFPEYESAKRFYNQIQDAIKNKVEY